MNSGGDEFGDSLSLDLHVEATQKLTEELIEAENRMRRRVDLLSEIVFETDPQGKFVFLNKAWETVLGFKTKECIGKALRSFFLPEDLPQFESWIALRNPAPDAQAPRLRFRRYDGRIIWIEISVSHLPKSGMVGVFRDVTAQKMAQDEVAKLSLVASSTDSFVIITGPHGLTEWANEAILKRTGYTLEEMMGKKPGHLLQGPHTDPGTVARIGTALREGRSIREELLNYTKKGNPYWVEIQISPVVDSNGRVVQFVSVQNDITELRAVKQQLIAAKEKAEEANNTKGLFLATVSHEMRTPLNAVLGMTHLLLDTPLNPTQQDYLTTIQQSGEALLTVISDILEISRIDAGTIEIHPKVFDVRGLIATVEAILRPKAMAQGLSLNCRIAENVPTFNESDPDRLRQILINLLDNGIKFTPRGKVELEVELTGGGNLPEEMSFHIRDSGIGIAPEDIPRLFKRFGQLNTSLSRQYGGTGLGLSICKSLLERLGGRIWVRSDPGRGSTFSFSIPCKAPNHPPLAIPTVPVQEEPSDDQTFPKVLVAEDNSVNQKLAVLLLKKLGYECDVVSDGMQAVDALRQEKYAIVLMDMQMPGMDGLEATRLIRAEFPKADQPYIVAMTANVSIEQQNACFDAGMDNFVAKPISPVKLKEALRRQALRLSTNPV